MHIYRYVKSRIIIIIIIIIIEQHVSASCLTIIRVSGRYRCGDHRGEGNVLQKNNNM